MSSLSLKSVSKRLKSGMLLFFTIAIIIITYLNLFSIWNSKLSIWRADKIEFKRDGKVCSNIPFIYNYFTKRKYCTFILYFLIPVEKRDISWFVDEIRFNECEYVYIFTSPEIPPLSLEEIRFILKNFNTTIIDTGGIFPVYEMKLDKIFK
jgi:predicted nucleic acid-binding Zn ribbon protein